MRHVPLDAVLEELFADPAGSKLRERLTRAGKRLIEFADAVRLNHIRRNGSNKWSPLKDRLTAKLGNKCWYTEVELVGAPLTIDHYRPVCDYWWLAYDPENYRVACPFANSPKHNEAHGCGGGKGDQFPLLAPGQRASSKADLGIEAPVILDPCSEADCELLAFQSDGRPVLNPAMSHVPNAEERVSRSKVLLNLDHPDFNSKREQLFHLIAEEVRAHEELPEASDLRTTIRARLAGRIAPEAAFSTAARYYLRLHRHLDWVEELLSQT
jgi:hypothetical protein